MTQRYSILQKKLQEVETQLNKALRLPPETPLHDRYAHDIEQRLDFLNTLFKAEVDSNPRNPHHLQHIGERRTLLETAFREWNEFRTTPHDPPLGTVSNCSCTESCLNEEVEEVVGCLVEEKKEKIGDAGKVEKGVKVRKLAAAMGGGILIGMGLMGFIMLSSCQCSPYMRTAMCLVPT